MQNEVGYMMIEERGRPELKAIEPVKERILCLVEEMKVTHLQRLKKAYNDKFRGDNRKISWSTLKKYMDELKSEGNIRDELLTQGKRKTMYLYRTNF